MLPRGAGDVAREILGLLQPEITWALWRFGWGSLLPDPQPSKAHLFWVRVFFPSRMAEVLCPLARLESSDTTTTVLDEDDRVSHTKEIGFRAQG